MLPKITPVVDVIIGAASQNHMNVSSSKNYNTLSNATGCPNCPKKLKRGFFNMLNPNLLSDHSSNTSLKAGLKQKWADLTLQTVKNS